MSKGIFIGVDLGGTKVLACPLKLGKENKVLGKAKNPTRVKAGAEAIIDDIEQTVYSSLEKAKIKLDDVEALGIGVPGAVNVDEGKIIMASNLGWKKINMKKRLEKKLKIPVFVDNDVNLGVLGEQQYGAARGEKDVAGVFWGTGIGGGFVLNGKIHHGHSFTAGEIGHLVMTKEGPACNCGNDGCLESFAGKWAISKAWHSNENHDSGNTTILKSKIIRQRYRSGDAFFVESVNRACEYIAMSLSAIVNLINPATIVLGGGMIESMPAELIPKIEKSMKKHIFPGASVQLKEAELGDYAVLTGAAALARQGVL